MPTDSAHEGHDDGSKASELIDNLPGLEEDLETVLLRYFDLHMTGGNPFGCRQEHKQVGRVIVELYVDTVYGTRLDPARRGYDVISIVAPIDPGSAAHFELSSPGGHNQTTAWGYLGRGVYLPGNAEPVYADLTSEQNVENLLYSWGTHPEDYPEAKWMVPEAATDG